MNRAQLAAALAAGTIDQTTHDAQVGMLERQEAATLPQAASATPATPVPAAPHLVDRVPAELAAGPQALPGSAPLAQVRQRGLGLQQAVRRISAAMASDDPAQIALAIADVVPAISDPVNAWDRQDWLGEVWRASDTTRPWINAIGAPTDLNARKYSGWAWDVKPTPGLYEGEKAEVPSNVPTTKEVGPFTAVRWAGGWDIDRAFADFSNDDYLTAFWNAAVEMYQLESDNWVASEVMRLAYARTNLPATTNVVQMLKSAVADGRAIRGGRINRVFLGSNLYSEFQDIQSDTLPLWLAKADVGVTPADGGANVGQLVIQEDATLPVNQMAYFDNRALNVREKRIPQLKAYDVGKAGIDLGFYSYGGLIITDERLVLKRTRTAAS